MNIDGSRVGTTDNFDGLKGRPITKLATQREGETDEEYKDRVLESPGQQEALAKLKDLGRWPANVIHDGSEEVLEGFPITGSARPARTGRAGGSNSERSLGMTADHIGTWPADTGGSAARFFYCAKASKSERNAGLEGLPEKGKVFNGQNAEPSGNAEGSVEDKFSTKPSQNFHPTVKPIALMRYLVKLVTPPNGTVLDPFLGSGTTAVAAILEGFNWMGCEMTEDYWPIIKARVAWAEAQPKTLL
jgi:site-specific DNA-methyltransferase (adenine-specific)